MQEVPPEPQNLGQIILLLLALVVVALFALFWGGIKLMTATRREPFYLSLKFYTGLALLLCGLMWVSKMIPGLLHIGSVLLRFLREKPPQ